MVARSLTFVLLALAGLLGCGPGPPAHEPVVAEGGAVRIPLAILDDGKVHFFTYRHDGTNVNFLVRRDGAGKLQTHLDACFRCYRYRRGYVVEGKNLVCIACRLAYDTDDEVWDFIGACAPISIHSSVDRQDLVIEERMLARAVRYF